VGWSCAGLGWAVWAGHGWTWSSHGREWAMLGMAGLEIFWDGHVLECMGTLSMCWARHVISWSWFGVGLCGLSRD
jgi:hypothetical protein